VTGGFSLPETVQSVRELLCHSAARNVFDEKLVAYGCLDVHFPRYERRYVLQRIRAFRVGKGFPRVPAVLPDGVGDLSYMVALAACAAFEVEPARIRTLIRESRSHDT